MHTRVGDVEPALQVACLAALFRQSHPRARKAGASPGPAALTGERDAETVRGFGKVAELNLIQELVVENDQPFRGSVDHVDAAGLDDARVDVLSRHANRQVVAAIAVEVA